LGTPGEAARVVPGKEKVSPHKVSRPKKFASTARPKKTWDEPKKKRQRKGQAEVRVICKRRREKKEGRNQTHKDSYGKPGHGVRSPRETKSWREKKTLGVAAKEMWQKKKNEVVKRPARKRVGPIRIRPPREGGTKNGKSE